MMALPSQISGLSLAEKLDMLDALWLDIEAQSPALSAEQAEELDLRMARYEENPSAVIAWKPIELDLLKQ